VAETRRTTPCRDLAVRFVLVAKPGSSSADGPSWELRGVRNWTSWPDECRQAFLGAVAEAQRRFDLR
jgi:hypothetical protein